MLEDVDEDAVASGVVRPDRGLIEPDEVQRLLRQPILAVRACLGVGECAVDTHDGANLVLDVAGCPGMPGVRAGRDAHFLAGAKRHPATRRSSSPGSSTPFSVRIVSAE